ncbi:DUF1380 family protein [Erwinia persicina]|uniref:DUF1380 family protein n=1 Tax=Erwinia persicina TaxID=55211 RepID=UPI0017830061|nr:DUF1380 family protein [Erwinia persicina]MBD8165439.1 DUF1380 family protein [Erwinia persicina]
MYGTVSEVCIKLLQQYAPKARVALIVWSDDEVMECLSGESITPEEAAEITANIDTLDSVHEYGVGQETLQVMLDNIREMDRESREVMVPVSALERVIKLAGEYIRREEVEGGEGAAKRNIPGEVRAFEQLIRIVSM